MKIVYIFNLNINKKLMKKTIYRYLPVCLCLFFWFLLGHGCTQEKEDLGESEDSIELPNVAERFF